MPKFVIQEHKATNLHWDFRIQLDGVLKSWALPKLPPRRTKEKRLAVQVEDHPLSYAKFEGRIKEGYGKGTVKIWDAGEFDLISRDKSAIKFELFGKKLKGTYILLNAKLGKDKKNWLFFKKEN
jgi:DNA ligase D-like protein (predicted 3'-phosphoesterase)